MAVFQYKAMIMDEDDEVTELGTIVSTDESEAMLKMVQYGFSNIRLERIRGISALWKGFTADIK